MDTITSFLHYKPSCVYCMRKCPESHILPCELRRCIWLPLRKFRSTSDRLRYMIGWFRCLPYVFAEVMVCILGWDAAQERGWTMVVMWNCFLIVVWSSLHMSFWGFGMEGSDTQVSHFVFPSKCSSLGIASLGYDRAWSDVPLRWCGWGVTALYARGSKLCI